MAENAEKLKKRRFLASLVSNGVIFLPTIHARLQADEHLPQSVAGGPARGDGGGDQEDGGGAAADEHHGAAAGEPRGVGGPHPRAPQDQESPGQAR